MVAWWEKILARGPTDPLGPHEAAALHTTAAKQASLKLPNEDKLRGSLNKFPGLTVTSTGGDDQTWWVMFHLDLNRPTTLPVVQYFSYEFNNTVTGSFPGAFYPKSPNPYLNQNLDLYLNWCIDVWSSQVTTLDVVEKLDSLFEVFELYVLSSKSSE